MIDQLRALLGLDDDEEAESSDDASDEEADAEAEDEQPPESQEPATPLDGLEDEVKALESKVNDLENDSETHENQISGLRGDMSDLEDDIEEVEQNVRDLLGIYDALSARVNPLVDGNVDSMPTLDTEGHTPDGRFDLTEEDTEPAASARDEATADTAAAGASEDTTEAESSENARTISDLKEETGMSSPNSPDTSATPSPHAQQTDQPHHVGSFTGTYASEVLAYEWLSMLIDLAGVSGTLRALAYYHDIGWISADVKTALQRRLAGAEFEGTESGQDRANLSADDHADSLSYVILLEDIEQEHYNH